MYSRTYRLLSHIRTTLLSNNVHINKNCLRVNCKQYSSFTNNPIILGIETSCDDTGCAVVNVEGKILGQALHSQEQLHLKHGGIIPPIASDQHRKHIEDVVKNALRGSGMGMYDMSAIAVTNRPGLPLSLQVGTRYARYLARRYNKPIIPIHHMEAHALTVRMGKMDEIKFPYLVLLISGGHCLLAVVRNIGDILLLGDCLDDAPGEALDKTARRLKLTNLPQYQGMCGGRAIELAAKSSKQPLMFNFPLPLTRRRDCQFSFAGLKNTALRHIKEAERKYEVSADQIIPNHEDLCAGFQWAVTRHLCHRTQRAMEYCEANGLFGTEKKTLVISGGVASNDFIYSGLNVLCREKEYNIFRPPPSLCTDNGVMIAWNGIEKYLQRSDIISDVDSVDIIPKCQLGESLIEKVAAADLKCSWIKLAELLKHADNHDHVEEEFIEIIKQ